MERVKTLVSLQQLPSCLLVERKPLQFFRPSYPQQLGGKETMGAFQHIRMLGMLRYELPFPQVEYRKSIRVSVVDAEPKKTRQVKDKE
jgi:hypothetical protein